jgi:hypothetical protein
MTGGLLQIVTSGKQDIYLTVNPEITFFKKVYRRHTNFSLELVEFIPEQIAEYNSKISFIINKGDALFRCYLEIELPNLGFKDSYVTNSTYITRKATNLNNLNTQKNIWSTQYANLKGYVDVEIELYRSLNNLLLLDNISINALKDEVTRFNYKNKAIKDKYKNKVDEPVYLKIDMSGYINSINKLIINSTSSYDETKYISKNEIINTLDQMYQSMLEYLKYYNLYVVKYSNDIDQITKEYLINFNYSKYIGHNYFSDFSIEIGGIEMQKYSNDILHINQMHKIKQDYMDNYLEMIGHTPKLYDFNNLQKGNTKLTVPLIFWFNKDAGSSLPLVALQYSEIIVNTKINDIRKIISFQDFEKMYKEICIINILNTNGYQQNKNLIYKNFNLNLDSKSITYNCEYVNYELLKLKFPDLTESDINKILINNGTIYTANEITKLLNPSLSDDNIQTMNGISGNNNQYLIDKIQWVGFMNDIKNPIYITAAPIIASYYPYIDFNLYYSLIPDPKVKLIAEIVFLDDVERAKFASSKLEYVVETFDEDIFNVKTQNFYDCELSFVNPIKELTWYIQPQVFIDGLTEYGQNIDLLFDNTMYFKNDPILKQKLTFNQLDLLLLNVDWNYYTYVMSYKYLNNIIPNGIYYHSFCLYPEESQPSGAFNLRQIKGKQYRIDINKDFILEYENFLNTLYKNSTKTENKKSLLLKFIAKSYNFFTVHKGSGKLIFGY